jgi:hypothetical protein
MQLHTPTCIITRWPVAAQSELYCIASPVSTESLHHRWFDAAAQLVSHLLHSQHVTLHPLREGCHPCSRGSGFEVSGSAPAPGGVELNQHGGRTGHGRHGAVEGAVRQLQRERRLLTVRQGRGQHKQQQPCDEVMAGGAHRPSAQCNAARLRLRTRSQTEMQTTRCSAACR